MYIVVLVTAPNKKEANNIAEKLLKKKLAACVNIIGGVRSIFWWQAKLDKAKESLLIIKTRKDKAARLIKEVKSVHSYSVPEIIALPICAGYGPYLKWIDESLRDSA